MRIALSGLGCKLIRGFLSGFWCEKAVEYRGCSGWPEALCVVWDRRGAAGYSSHRVGILWLGQEGFCIGAGLSIQFAGTPG